MSLNILILNILITLLMTAPVSNCDLTASINSVDNIQWKRQQFCPHCFGPLLTFFKLYCPKNQFCFNYFVPMLIVPLVLGNVIFSISMSNYLIDELILLHLFFLSVVLNQTWILGNFFFWLFFRNSNYQILIINYWGLHCCSYRRA